MLHRADQLLEHVATAFHHGRQRVQGASRLSAACCCSNSRRRSSWFLLRSSRGVRIIVHVGKTFLGIGVAVQPDDGSRAIVNLALQFRCALAWIWLR